MSFISVPMTPTIIFVTSVKRMRDRLSVYLLLIFFYHIQLQIGAAYNKDAYVQNELVLAALKTATEHLVAGGSFCTKVYRSTDYNALIWVFQQLFEEVQAMKPNSSRSQSSEIFIVCLKYTAPNSIDPKLLDPNHVFKEINDPGLQKVDVMHKKYEKLNKRHRTGYDESLGMLLTSKVSVLDFIHSKDTVAAIRVLTDANIIEFPEECDEIASHPATTDEIRLCFSDLRVLGKLDFKKILKWREIMRTFFFSSKKEEKEGEESEAAVEVGSKRRNPLDEMDVDEEIERMNTKLNQADKRDKKKTRLKASKERQRQVLGISANAFGDADDMELFSMGHSTRASQLEGVNDVYIDDDEDKNLEIWQDDYAKLDEKLELPSIILADADDLEAELETQYKRFVAGKRILTEQNINEEQLMLKDVRDEKTLEGRSHSAKAARLARTSSALLDRREEEDYEAGHSKNANAMKADLSAYVKLLSGTQVKTAKGKGKKGEEVQAANETDTSEDDDEEGGDDEWGDDDAPLQSKSVRLTGGARAEKWFTHPIFNESLIVKEDIEKDAKKDHRRANQTISEMPKTDKDIRKEKRKKSKDRQDRREVRKNDENKTENVTHFDFAPRSSVDFGDEEEGVDNEGVVLDSETIRQRALIRQGMGTVMREPHKAAPGKKRKADAMEGYETVTGTDADDTVQMKDQEEEIEIVPRDRTSNGGDDRSYDSDNEQYDSHDRAMTLALGTLMLRRSREKALVDASYNRFTWNDSKDLPAWFLDDEMKHNKPQLPVPEALLDQVSRTLLSFRNFYRCIYESFIHHRLVGDKKIKSRHSNFFSKLSFVKHETSSNFFTTPSNFSSYHKITQIKAKFMLTGTKEIKKVAEARARKKKRAASTLKAAKKSATMMAENSEMSEKQKLKVIKQSIFFCCSVFFCHYTFFFSLFFHLLSAVFHVEVLHFEFPRSLNIPRTSPTQYYFHPNIYCYHQPSGCG